MHHPHINLKFFRDDQSGELKRLQRQIEDVTSKANTLERDNKNLHSQQEFLNAQMRARQTGFEKQLKIMKDEKDGVGVNLDHSYKRIKEVESIMVEQEIKIDTISKELMDRTIYANKLEGTIRKKDSGHVESTSNAENLKVKSCRKII